MILVTETLVQITLVQMILVTVTLAKNALVKNALVKVTKLDHSIKRHWELVTEFFKLFHLQSRAW